MVSKKSKNSELREVMIAYIPSLKYKKWDSQLSYQLRSTPYKVEEPVIDTHYIPTNGSKITAGKNKISSYYRLSEGDLDGNFVTKYSNIKVDPQNVLKHRVQHIRVSDNAVRRAVKKGFDKGYQIFNEINKVNKKRLIPKLPKHERYDISDVEINKELERLAIRTRARRRRSGKTSLRR